MEEADLYQFLKQFRLGVLGSVYGSSPQAALVGFAVTPELELVFDTVNSSRKYRNLLAGSACSFVIGWDGEQTVQYEGEARQLSSPELESYQKIYLESWPDGVSHLKWPGLVCFVVRPRWIRFSDYDRNPPLIREFRFEDGKVLQF